MLFGGVLFFQTLNLDFGSDYLNRVRNCCGNHAAYDASRELIHFPLLELLVHHVIEASEEAVLPAGSHHSAEECHDPLFPIDVHNGSADARVLVEARQFVSCLYNVERVRDYCADNSC